MSLVSRNQFALIAETSISAIGVYVKRGKIIVGADKKIDTDLMLNKMFLKNQKRNNKKSIKGKTPPPVVSELQNKPATKETTAEKRARKRAQTEADEIVKWTVRKERANAVKAETDADLKKLQLAKLMGQLIPIDLMRRIFKINIQNIFMSFENELVNLASIYCDILAGGDRKKLSEIVDLMRQNLSKIIKETNNNAAKEILGAIDEYSETRSRGERK